MRGRHPAEVRFGVTQPGVRFRHTCCPAIDRISDCPAGIRRGDDLTLQYNTAEYWQRSCCVGGVARSARTSSTVPLDRDAALSGSSCCGPMLPRTTHFTYALIEAAPAHADRHAAAVRDVESLSRSDL
jgi:hypothetical protein